MRVVTALIRDLIQKWDPLMKTKPIQLHTCLWLITVMAAFAVCVPTASAALTNRYVIKNNAGTAVPYDSMANAASNIQVAIDYANAGETVLVAAATYDLGGTNVAGYSLTNRVYISKIITVRSIDNNPTNTIIKGAWDPVATNGPAAIRCVYMVANSSLIGFTLTNGATLTTGDAISRCGGGVYASSATVSNCIIVGNAAFGYSAQGAGGVNGGTVFNSVIAGNRSLLYGGGADVAVLSNCTLSGNSAAVNGGGAHRSTLYGCLVSNNTAVSGGGAAGYNVPNPCKLYDCMIVNNRATTFGGGVYQDPSLPCSMVSNCIIAFNSAQQGGGARGMYLFNCLVFSNTATLYGPGVHQCFASNSVFLYNTSSRNFSWYNCLIIGGGLFEQYSAEGKMYNCTFVGCNQGFASTAGQSPELYNCISWSNNLADSGVSAFNSCGVAGPNNNYTNTLLGNTTNNPCFVADGSGYETVHIAGNYRLRASSPCVNKGTNQAWMTNAVDLDGKTRIRYGTADMGAYETLYRGAIFKFR